MLSKGSILKIVLSTNAAYGAFHSGADVHSKVRRKAGLAFTVIGRFAAPFTKESLLYREIFEKYYPGQGEMIVDFWMPNKSWKGCDVNDPSARVLSNYGASGK